MTDHFFVVGVNYDDAVDGDETDDVWGYVSNPSVYSIQQAHHQG